MNVQRCPRTPQPKADDLTERPAETTFDIFSQSSRLSSCILEISLELPKDKNVYPLVHVYLVFLSSLLLVQRACISFEEDSTWRTIGKDVPWMNLCLCFNTLAAGLLARTDKIWSEDFPTPSRPISMDYLKSST